jgi:hypothetical protein
VVAVALLLMLLMVWIAAPLGLTTRPELELLQAIRTTGVTAGTSTASIRLPAHRICLLAFYVSRDKLEAALGRRLTFKERLHWTFYGTEADNINLVATIAGGELQTLAKFHHSDFLGGDTSFRQGCVTGSTLVLRTTPAPYGRAYQLTIED